MSMLDAFDRQAMTDENIRYAWLYGRARGALEAIADCSHPDTARAYAAGVLALLDEIRALTDR